MSDIVTLTINSQRIEARAGATILEAAQAAGIRIPTLCYHPALPPEGACRICVVEVKGQRLLQPACTFPVAEGMDVQTDTPKVRSARKFILELLLSDHPQDCLTCEMCGDCELQALAYEYGIKQSPFSGERRRYPVDDRDPFILRDLEKCVLCRRCVRACSEIQAVDAIGIAYRGFRSKVATAFDTPLLESNCVFCGQCVSVCPTGALIEKDSVGLGRTWEVRKVTTVCPYCGVGCNFDLNVLDGKVIKVTSNWEVGPNKGALCVKGRFGWQFLHSPDRLTTPLLRRDLAESWGFTVDQGQQAAQRPWGDEFVPVSWDTALDLIAKRLAAIRQEHGPDSIGFLCSAKCTNEENYLLQKLARAVIGTNNIDHCARL